MFLFIYILYYYSLLLLLFIHTLLLLSTTIITITIIITIIIIIIIFISGVMDVQYSEVKVENCTMTNSYSDYSGGVFYANNNLSFDVANVQAYNATARRAVGII